MTIMEQATFIIFAMIIISGIIIAIWVHLKQKYYAADFERRLALQHTEICKLKNDEGSWIEREALVCPEGVSFETVIKQLQADVERLQKALDIT